MEKQIIISLMGCFLSVGALCAMDVEVRNEEKERSAFDEAIALLEKDAEINKKGAYGDTPLGALCAMDVQVAEDANPSVDAVGNVLVEEAVIGTPLGLATKDGHEEECELLLAREAEVNQHDKHGMTPLQVVVKYVVFGLQASLTGVRPSLDRAVDPEADENPAISDDLDDDLSG